jgi:hypothetical protein
MKRYLLIWTVCLFFVHSYGQINTSYKAETFGSAATGEHTPFWMVNHNWGMTALDAGNFYAGAGVFHEQILTKDWSWEAGIDLAGGSSSPYGNVWMQQLYGRLNWKIWRLNLGSREEYVSFQYLQTGKRWIYYGIIHLWYNFDWMVTHGLPAIARPSIFQPKNRL